MLATGKRQSVYKYVQTEVPLVNKPIKETQPIFSTPDPDAFNPCRSPFQYIVHDSPCWVFDIPSIFTPMNEVKGLDCWAKQ